MRVFGLLTLVPAIGLPARAHVINGETPFDDTMLHRRASEPGDRDATARQDVPARAEPATAESPPASGADRRD